MEELTAPVSVPRVAETMVILLPLTEVITPVKSSMALRVPPVMGALGIVRMFGWLKSMEMPLALVIALLRLKSTLIPTLVFPEIVIGAAKVIF